MKTVVGRPHSKANLHVATEFAVNVFDARLFDLEKGDRVDLLIDDVDRIGCIQKSEVGRKLYGSSLLLMRSVWKDGHPSIAEMAFCEIIPAGDAKKLGFPEGLCFKFPKEARLDGKCAVDLPEVIEEQS